MSKCLVLAGTLLLLAVMVFPTGSYAQDSAIAAKIGDETLTVSDFDTIVGYLDDQKRQALEKNPQLKENLLLQIVQTRVVADLARANGFDKRPEIQKQMELFVNNFLVNEFLKKEVAQKMKVSESEVKSYYEGHKDEFKIPEMVKARHILTKLAPAASDDEKKKAREKADDILAQIRAGADFEKLASELSDDPGSKQKGGDLGFFARGRMVKPFEDTAFSLKPGEVSGIVETQFGYHIIKTEEKKDEYQEPFEKVKDRIHQKLLQEGMRAKVTEYIDKAMKEAHVEMHPEALGVLKK